MKEPLDHLRSKKKPVRKAVWIAGDSELAEELSELEAVLSRARIVSEGARPDRREAALRDLAAAEEAFAAKKEEVRATSIKFVFQSMGTKSYEELIQAHPPTETQIKKLKSEGEDQVPFNPETLPIALIVASCVEPEMDKAEMHEWLSGDEWNSFEIMTLFMAATEVNNSRRIINMGKD